MENDSEKALIFSTTVAEVGHRLSYMMSEELII
jgi:hypothetical protein